MKNNLESVGYVSYLSREGFYLHIRVSSARENIASFKRNFGPSRFSANLQAARPLKRLGTNSSSLIYERITEQALSLRIPLPSASTFANCNQRKTPVANTLEAAILVSYSSRANFLFDKFFPNAECNPQLVSHRKLASEDISLLHGRLTIQPRGIHGIHITAMSMI